MFAATVTMAIGQVSVDAGASTSVGGTVGTNTDNNSTSVGTGVDASVGVSADTNTSTSTSGATDASTGSFADLNASITSSASTDFSTITDASDINIVLISSLDAEAQGSAWAELKSAYSANVDRLQGDIEENASLNARLTAELSAAGEFTLDDVQPLLGQQARAEGDERILDHCATLTLLFA